MAMGAQFSFRFIRFHRTAHVTGIDAAASAHGQLLSIMTFDHDQSGRIVAIYVVSAPSKLTHISK
ncbi:MAG TPA: hypothetical protein VJ625_12970 [Propionibacteriaceae bacterium]|nr:hypothetical protein [Propionibacteriaceae bacterium]